MNPLRIELGLVIGLAGLVACATTRTSPPSRGEISLPSTYTFKALRREPVAVTVLDQRSDLTDSGSLVSLTSALLTKTLQNAGVTVDATAADRLEVHIVEYRADFGRREWKGCTKLLTVFRATGSDPIRLDSTKCVTRANVWGYGSADAALHASYKDSLVDLLAQIDLMTSRTRASGQSATPIESDN